MSYAELIIGVLVTIIGSTLALNIRGCAEMAADFVGNTLFSAFHHNEVFLRIPAAFFATLGLIFALMNLKVLIFGF
ncbi:MULTISPECIES: hypothetical protein [unclassified Streptomyces]|uniref:hypothetical protein n=1 Tax=unclassified Streptomyces TaxID=2593676 RepID=UPI0029A50CE8|nr:hypothetical protein [Streptomyces sp. AK04-4c]MDX3682599.1 hypothetical protein [Streptomyces sp. AK04-4c]